MKKGITAGVFNWIFVMIAGAVILLFFVKIISVQTAITEREIGATVLSDTQTILSGRATTEDSQAIIEIPDKAFEFICQEPCNLQTGCDSWFGIPGGDLRIQTPLQPIFSTRKIETSRLYAFVLGWDVPFHTSNFLILAQPGMKIAFPGPVACSGDELCSEVLGLIPTPLKDARIVLNDGPINHPAVRNINFTPGCIASESKNIYCVREATREITFPNGRTHNYYMPQALVGAIFSEDSFAYECNMKKAFFRLNRVVEVYEDKRIRLADDWGSNPSCLVQYLAMSSNLTQIGEDYRTNTPFNFESAMDNIVNSNNLIRRNSCGSVY